MVWSYLFCHFYGHIFHYYVGAFRFCFCAGCSRRIILPYSVKFTMHTLYTFASLPVCPGIFCTYMHISCSHTTYISLSSVARRLPSTPLRPLSFSFLCSETHASVVHIFNMTVRWPGSGPSILVILATYFWCRLSFFFLCRPFVPVFQRSSHRRYPFGPSANKA